MKRLRKKRRLTLPREEIPWYPAIEAAKCDGCGICLDFCPKTVFSLDPAGGKVLVTAPYCCVVLCRGCERRCPNQAISFPDRKDFERYVC
ncbi:MAG: ferredoxin family protein [Candidatus Latescibacteria bacterium]|nr:ferredoxin family protein [Candidatus Latescibacterota bacterium]